MIIIKAGAPHYGHSLLICIQRLRSYERTIGRNGSAYNEASDGASSFLGLIKEKLVWLPTHIMPIMPELLPTIEFVGANQALYDADEKIYGSFQELAEQIKKTLRQAFGVNLARGSKDLSDIIKYPQTSKIA